MQSTMKSTTAFNLNLNVVKTQSDHCGTFEETLSFHLEFFHEEKIEYVVCSAQELKMISCHLFDAIMCKLKCNLSEAWSNLCLTIECIGEHLKCFATITFEAFVRILHCVKQAIKKGICLIVGAGALALECLKDTVECVFSAIKETSYHILVELAAAFHWLKFKVFAGWAKIKLLAYWGACSLRSICKSLKVKFNYGHEQFKRACKQMKCYLRGALHCAIDKIKACVDWIKNVFLALGRKIRHVKESFLSHVHGACLKVLLPCMSAEVIGKVSVCHTEAKEICAPLMWTDLKVHEALWKSSEKSKKCTKVIKNLSEWTELHEHIKKVTVSCKGAQSVEYKNTTKVVSKLFDTISHPTCTIKPHTVCFKDTVIRSEWSVKLSAVTTVKRIQPKRCTFEQANVDASTYTSFSITYEELSTDAFFLIHQQVTSLTVSFKTGTKSLDQSLAIKNRGVTELLYQDLIHDSVLKGQVDEYYRLVVKHERVSTLHLQRIKIEIVERTTQKVIRVTCPCQ